MSNDKSAASSKYLKPRRKAGRKARASLSCGPCRSRKLKCNRQQPCQNCIVRNELSACIFTGSEHRAASTIFRIDRLENLMTSLVSQTKDERELRPFSDNITTQDNTPAHSSISQASSAVAAASERIKKAQDMRNVDDARSAYTGTAHYNHRQQSCQRPNIVTNTPLEPDDCEADRLIKIYQDEMTNQSPFVIIPPGTTASDLRRDLPFLYRAVIIATSSYHPSRQAFYEKQIVEFVTDHLLIRNHKNLELLQGILLFVTWYKRTAVVGGQANNLLQLAIALVADLNLKRDPTWFEKSKLALAISCSSQTAYGPKTMDERRALLGCFYLSSAAAMSSQRIDPMRLTRQIEESCQTLMEKAEYPTDLQLVYDVKTQYLTDRIAQTIHINEWDTTLPSKPPVAMHIKAFQSEITAMKESLPPSLHQNTSVLMHLDFASIRLYEVALLDDTRRDHSTADPPPTDPARLENLYSLLLSTKSFLTAVLAAPGATYLSLSYIAWAQFAYALMMLDRLTFFTSPSCPSWDIPFVRSIMDFSAVLDAFASRFEQARAHTFSLMAPGEKGVRAEQEDLYNRYVKKTQIIRAWFESRVNGAAWDWEQAKGNALAGTNNEMQQSDAGVTSTDGAVGSKDGDGQLDPSLFDGLHDDSFWLDLAADWGGGLGAL